MKIEADKLLKDIANLISDYEDSHNQDSIVGCYVEFSDKEENIHEYDGKKFTNDRVLTVAVSNTMISEDI
jgi:hypothetical protein